MHHEPASKLAKEKASDAKARLGLILFGVYSLIYAGFILINTFSPSLMRSQVPGGVNLATAYGLGLIALAIVLGVVYHILCTRLEDRLNRAEGDDVP